MNWYRAKTILIILFLLSDLFLLGNIIVSTRKLTSVTPEIIESTVNILNKNNITIDAAIIPKNILSAPYAEADNVIYDFEEFAKLFLGDSSSKVDEYSYKSEQGTIYFDGDSFSYKNGAENNSTGTDEKKSQILAIEFLKNKGFDLSDAEVTTNKTASGFSVTFNNTFASLPLFNSKVEVKISGTTVSSAEGIWFNISSTKGQDNELKTVTSSLIDFIPLAENSTTEITNMALGYTVPDSALYHKSAVLVPVWEITETSNEKHYLDARTPE